MRHERAREPAGKPSQENSKRAAQRERHAHRCRCRCRCACSRPGRRRCRCTGSCCSAGTLQIKTDCDGRNTKHGELASTDTQTTEQGELAGIGATAKRRSGTGRGATAKVQKTDRAKPHVGRWVRSNSAGTGCTPCPGSCPCTRSCRWRRTCRGRCTPAPARSLQNRTAVMNE